MKNTKTHYPVVGTSALQVQHTSNQKGHHIIAFPGTPSVVTGAHAEQAPSFRTRFIRKMDQSEALSELRFGSMRGLPFQKVKTWQSFAAGCTCFVTALIVIFFGA
ncbi:MAG: hypothetical protein RR572_02680 [Raoultibacter sp.]